MEVNPSTLTADLSTAGASKTTLQAQAKLKSEIDPQGQRNNSPHHSILHPFMEVMRED
jgi:hypothetical protein